MIRLLRKETALTFLPIVWLMPLLCLLSLIPNHPACIPASYAVLTVFIIFNYAKENRDLEYMSALPVARKDIALSKVAAAAFSELLQLFSAAVFAAVGIFGLGNGERYVSMAPNLAFFGFILTGYALFNVVFLTRYFSSGGKTGLAAVFGSVLYASFVVAAEIAVACAPALSVLDGVGTGWEYRLLVFAIGVIIYAAGLVAAWRIGTKKLERISF